MSIIKPKSKSATLKPASAGKFLLIMAGFFSGIIVVFVVAVVVIGLSGNGKTRVSPGAKLFVTDYLQADKKTYVVFFGNNRLDDSAFQEKLKVAKQIIRVGGYSTAPVQIGSTASLGNLQYSSTYKICKPDTTECLTVYVQTYESKFVTDFQMVAPTNITPQ